MSDKTTGKPDHTEHSERYRRGLAKMGEMFGDAGAQTVQSLETSAPDLGRYLAEYVFGDVLSRPGLDLKSREIATVAALTALGTAGPQLRAHIRGALKVGCSQQEIIEIMIQMTVYAGFPAALNGVQAAKEVFAEYTAEK
jgi:4-carboxymuconolactone decarboxylase